MMARTTLRRLRGAVKASAPSAIGPTFAAELQVAGLGGTPCSWSDTGEYNISALTTQQQQTFAQVLAAHDPNAMTPQMQFSDALASGLITTWSASTGLDGTYPIDPTTQANVTAENVSLLVNQKFTNGQTTRQWPTISGTTKTLSVAQFQALATAIALYVDQLYAALTAASEGQDATWPSNAVNITG